MSAPAPRSVSDGPEEAPGNAPQSPLGITSDEFADAFGPRMRGKRAAATAAYARLFREGVAEFPLSSGAEAPPGSGPAHTRAVTVPPLGRVLREDSDEGEVIKFTQVVPKAPEGQRDGGTKGQSADRTGHSPASAPDPVPLSLRPSVPLSLLETESVLIPMIGRSGVPTYTLCVSSQVGCAMGCTFCETAQMGLVRSLSAAEIVGQWFAATHAIGTRPKNIVFMGMGEPMDNLDEVIRAIAVLTDSRGVGHAMNKITVSTVGRLDGIARLAEQVHKPGWHRLNLAVSLNAPNDEVRSRIMPVNRAMPMAALREALLGWPKYGGAKICIEYVLIPGVNDGPGHAREVAAWVRPLPACVNLIPYNPRRDSPWPAPEESRVVEFLGWLTDAGAYAKRRRTKGRAMMGACGQLGSERIRKRKFVEVLASGSERTE